MKKILLLAAICGLAIVSCKDKAEDVPTTNPYLGISTDASIIPLGTEGTIIVNIDRNVGEKVSFSIAQSGTSIELDALSGEIDNYLKPTETNRQVAIKYESVEVGVTELVLSSEYKGVRYTTSVVEISVVKPILSISGNKLMETGTTANLTVTSTYNLLEDAEITAVSSDPTKVQVNTETVTMATGKKRATISVTALAKTDEGSPVTVSITTTSDMITVSEDGGSFPITVVDPEEKPVITATGEQLAATQGNAYVFTIFASFPVSEDVTFTVTSSNASVATISNPSLTIYDGETEVDGIFKTTSTAQGVAIITVATSNKTVDMDPTLSKFKVKVGANAEITVTGPADNIEPEATGTFTIDSDIIVGEDVIFTITSDDEGIATVPETLTMKAGTNTISGSVTGVADGTANISIATDNTDITITTAGFAVTVETQP